MERNDILKKLGISQLSEMQRQTGDAFAQSSSDIVVLSPTGTGKTLAYLLPLIDTVQLDSDEVQAMVVVPGRELAQQTAQVLASTGTGVRGYACYGGRMAMDEHRELRKVCPQIVIGTPGRLLDHLNKGNLSALHVRTLVIDEFDKCLDMGFADEMITLVHKLKFVNRHVLLSATQTDDIPRFVNMSQTTTIDFRAKNNTLGQRISTYILRSEKKDKLDTLYAYLCGTGDESTIVFANYRESVTRIGRYLEEKGFVVSMFHGGLDQNEREAALYKFSNGSSNVMVCTDLASRGLDIADIQNVAHYHIPETQQAYTHRIGRTARWEAQGNNTFILGPDETLPPYVKEYEALVLPETLPAPARPRMCTIYIGKGKRDKISKGDILGFLCKTGNLKSSDIGKIDVKERYAYVAVSAGKCRALLSAIKDKKIKGLKTVYELIK